MDLITALNTLNTLTTILGNLAANASQISALIAKAQKEGRTTLTADEWRVITTADDTAKQYLVDAIAKALLTKGS